MEVSPTSVFRHSQTGHGLVKYEDLNEHEQLKLIKKKNVLKDYDQLKDVLRSSGYLKHN